MRLQGHRAWAVVALGLVMTEAHAQVAPPAPTPGAAAVTPGSAPVPASVSASSSSKSKAAKAPGASKGKFAGEGPIDWRCDNAQVISKSNGVRLAICRGNVVVRRSDLMFCCTTFEGVTDGTGQLQKATCIDDVRAVRGVETMWSDRAEYLPQSSDLLLTGRPMLRRAASILEGERITLNVNDDKARVDKPRGHFLPDDLKVGSRTPPPPPQKPPPLPEKCPLVAAPRH